MDIDRRARPVTAARRALMARLLPGGCIGCPGCRGYCAALLELLSLPEAILKLEPRP